MHRVARVWSPSQASWARPARIRIFLRQPATATATQRVPREFAVPEVDAFAKDALFGESQIISTKFLGQSVLASPLHPTFGVRIDGCRLAELMHDPPALATTLRQLLQSQKMVVFSGQSELEPEAHVALCKLLGGSAGLDDTFSSNHAAGLSEEEGGHYMWPGDGGGGGLALRPTANAYEALPPAVWPISNQPDRGTVNAGDGGFHCDGAWFGDHFRYMSFLCRSQLSHGGGHTFFASSEALLRALGPEERHFLAGVLVEYTDRMVYPGGNSINPSGGRPTVIPLVSESGTGADRQLAISAFLDPKYWRRVYLCDAARESSPEARRRLFAQPFWRQIVGDDSAGRRGGESAEAMSAGAVQELAWAEGADILEGINVRLGPEARTHLGCASAVPRLYLTPERCHHRASVGPTLHTSRSR